MPDDARTRAHEVLFAAFSIGGSIMHVNPYEAVDALLAAGWAPPPAPFNPYHTETGNTTPSLAPPPALASDDVKARAIGAAKSATRAWCAGDGDDSWEEFIVEALADAGLLRGPETSSAAPEGAALPGTEEPVAAQDSNTRTRSLPPFHKVAGTCPACSGSTLMLGAGDRVTCSLIGCPDPMAASRRLVPLDDAAIERAARAIADRFFEYENSEDREFCLETARVALAAPEETPHA